MQIKQNQSIFTLNNDGSLSTYITVDKECNMRTINQKDFEQCVKLFGDEQIIKSFGDGKPFSSSSVRAAMDRWRLHYDNGQPDSPLGIFDSNDSLLGIVTINGGDRKGSVEFGMLFHKNQQGKGLGNKILQIMVNIWAPLVKLIGEGKGQDKFNDKTIQEKFCCFQGEALTIAVATHNLPNIGSRDILLKNGFRNSTCFSSITPIHYEAKYYNSSSISSLMTLEEHVIKTYFNQQKENHLNHNVLYSLNTPDGKNQVISFCDRYEKVKVHVERNIGDSPAKL